MIFIKDRVLLGKEIKAIQIIKTALIETYGYRCSKCVIRCLKCEAPRLNTNAPYVRGCNEARLAVKRAFPCVCIRDCEV